MDVTVKVKFGSARPRLEGFWERRFLIYVAAANTIDTNDELKLMLSNHFGIPVQRIELRRGEDSDSKVFYLG